MRTTFYLLAAVLTINTASAAEGDKAVNCTQRHCVVETPNPHAAPQPHAAKADAPAVLNTLERIVKAYSSGNLPEYEWLLDEDCSYFYQERKQMIVARAKVVDH